MRLLIYGLGKTTQFIEKKILNLHTVIGYTDSYARISKFNGKPFYDISMINKLDFDYVIITIKECKTAWDIKLELSSEYNIPDEKIIPFFVYANYQNYEIKLSKAKDDAEVLIFGNSHATFGYLAEQMSKPTINLSCSAQDIISNFHIFEKCYEMYGNKLKNIKYIVIDMYDYNVYNVDNSLGNSYITYLKAGGYEEERNWKQNSNHIAGNTFEQDIFKILGRRIHDEEASERMKRIFGTNVFCDYMTEEEIANNNWEHIETDAPLTTRQILSSVVTHKREDTISNNIEIMHVFLKKIKMINPNIHIVLTLIPRYETMEIVMKSYMQEWEKMFNFQIAQYKELYGIKFINFKKCIELYSNCRFYRDVSHLNTIGANCLTNMLDECLS